MDDPTLIGRQIEELHLNMTMVTMASVILDTRPSGSAMLAMLVLTPDVALLLGHLFPGSFTSFNC